MLLESGRQDYLPVSICVKAAHKPARDPYVNILAL